MAGIMSSIASWAVERPLVSISESSLNFTPTHVLRIGEIPQKGKRSTALKLKKEDLAFLVQ
jgi:hypothetical protein